MNKLFGNGLLHMHLLCYIWKIMYASEKSEIDDKIHSHVLFINSL